MRIALDFPNFGDFADPEAMVELAVTAETAGWDGFFVWDHIVIGDGVPVADPWVLLAAVAQATHRLALGPMVTPLPRRRPWVLARQATTLHRLSRGRLILGVGLGHPADTEFGTFGEPTDHRERADLLDEGLDVVRGMWSGERFHYSGRHHTVVETSFAPRPGDGGIPIWVAGMWPNRRPFRRAARYDGVYPIATDYHLLAPDEVAEIVAYVTTHRVSDDPFDVTIGGPPPNAADVAAYEAAGLTWYQVGPDPAGEPLEAILDWVAAGPRS